MSTLKVTPSFYERERHIEILRPLTKDDFEFQFRLAYRDSHEDITASRCSFGANIDASLKPEIAAELAQVFPNDPSWFRGREYAMFTEGISINNFRGCDTVAVDFRGCRNQGSRMKKAQEARKAFDAGLEAFKAKLADSVVDRINKLVAQIVEEGNHSYHRSLVQCMTSMNGWSNIDHMAAVEEKLKELAELRQRVENLERDILMSRNKAALMALENNEWQVTHKDKHYQLTPDVVEELKKIYNANEAFVSNNIRIG